MTKDDQNSEESNKNSSTTGDSAVVTGEIVLDGDKSNGDSVNSNVTEVSSVTDIPVTLKDNFENFEDIPRDSSDNPLYASPTEVMQNTQRMSNEIAEEVELDEDLEEALSMDSGLESFLSQLNITRRQFLTFLIFFLVLVVMVVVSFVYLFKFFGSSQEQVKVLEVPQVVDEVQIPVLEEATDEVGFFDKVKNIFKSDEVVNTDGKNEVKSEDVEVVKPVTDSKSEESVIPASDIGKTVKSVVQTRSISATRLIGSKTIKEDRLSYFVRTYRKVRNIFNTDLFSYLSQTPDRKKGFDLFLIQFKGANEEAKLVYEELRQEVDELSLRVEKLRTDTQEVENKFFTSLDNLDSEVISENLKAFQEISQKRDYAISELKAREAIADRYAKALPVIETKIKAIEVNQDPFVKGVKVVEYDQVDLDLIIDIKK